MCFFFLRLFMCSAKGSKKRTGKSRRKRDGCKRCTFSFIYMRTQSITRKTASDNARCN